MRVRTCRRTFRIKTHICTTLAFSISVSVYVVVVVPCCWGWYSGAAYPGAARGVIRLNERVTRPREDSSRVAGDTMGTNRPPDTPSVSKKRSCHWKGNVEKNHISGSSMANQPLTDFTLHFLFPAISFLMLYEYKLVCRVDTSQADYVAAD